MHTHAQADKYVAGDVIEADAVIEQPHTNPADPEAAENTPPLYKYVAGDVVEADAVIELPRANPADPEVAENTSHELAGSSPFSGRAGCIGSTSGGTITTIVTRDELEALAKVTSALRLSPVQQDEAQAGVPLLEMMASDGEAGGDEGAAEGEDGAVTAAGAAAAEAHTERTRKGLEDIFNLM
ncbi:hypothetical protein FOA52_012653 [Chlamydomonas sp. UWO 241]|nr:hypothetical protein FOA52_012653 [Chlamydomonas sp. UWO 241]